MKEKDEILNQEPNIPDVEPLPPEVFVSEWKKLYERVLTEQWSSASEEKINIIKSYILQKDHVIINIIKLL